MENSKDLILRLKNPMGTRKNSSEVCRQFGHASSESFASPALVYSAPIYNKETLQQPNFCVCQTIFKRPGTFERVRQSMIRHVHVLTDVGGAHFEHTM